jgi:signal transduction histidine kinase
LVDRSRGSLEWKLPLAICSVLLIVLGAFMTIAYVAVRRSALESSDERLRNLTTQFAGLLSQEAPPAVARLRATAAKPEVQSYLAAPDSNRKMAAAQAMISTVRPELVAAVELWDGSGHRVLAVGDTTALPQERLLESMAGRDSGAVGPFHAIGDSLILPTIVPVLARGNRLGYLVEWRHIPTSPEEGKGILQLIGPQSAFLLGSPSTGVWTDRVSIVPPPPVSLEELSSITSYDRPGLGRRRAMAAGVPGVPWMVIIEFTEQGVLAPAQRFLTQTLMIGTALLLAGLIGIWLIVRQMTRPLRQLTQAAEAISQGDYSRRVRFHREDELGSLAIAFNSMAERVEETRARLQDKIEELRNAQEQFAHSQRMEAVGRLAGGIAHDFNNLLTVILGETELAIKAPEEDPTLALTEIRRAGERAAVLTRQLLAFSRRQLVEPTVFSVNEMVVDLEKMLGRLIGEDIQMVTRTAAELPTVRADRGQIEQVLVNLVVNARDAMPTGGRVTVETFTVRLDAAYAQSRADVVPGDYVMISVSDTGHGMNADVQSHLFEPFFTTKDRSKGTGLGLATSYGIVKQSGGHIAAYSEVGVGTTMRVYLPCVQLAPEIRTIKEDYLPTGTETILLVEDDLPVRATAARILTGQGYQVIQAGDGASALAVLNGQGRPIQLMITDVVLPGMGGRELAEQVAALRPEIRILYVSGYTDDVILQHRLVERDVSLLQKPFTASSLASKVRDVLDRQN